MWQDFPKRQKLYIVFGAVQRSPTSTCTETQETEITLSGKIGPIYCLFANTQKTKTQGERNKKVYHAPIFPQGDLT